MNDWRPTTSLYSQPTILYCHQLHSRDKRFHLTEYEQDRLLPQTAFIVQGTHCVFTVRETLLCCPGTQKRPQEGGDNGGRPDAPVPTCAYTLKHHDDDSVDASPTQNKRKRSQDHVSEEQHRRKTRKKEVQLEAELPSGVHEARVNEDTVSHVSAVGLLPDPFMPTTFPPPNSSQYSAKTSPPTPHWMGSTTFSANATATAASAQLPPLLKMLNPASAAWGWEQATMPWSARPRRLERVRWELADSRWDDDGFFSGAGVFSGGGGVRGGR